MVSFPLYPLIMTQLSEYENLNIFFLNFDLFV